MAVVSSELRDETQFSLGVESVMQPEGPAQLAHTQVPLQRSCVLRKGEPLLPLLPQRHRFAQTVDELRGGRGGGGAEVNTKVPVPKARICKGDLL